MAENLHATKRRAWLTFCALLAPRRCCGENMFETLYALILRLYPVGFRKEYGDEALLLFRDRRLHERGVLGALRHWFDIALELVPSLLYEYARETGDTNEPQTNGGPALCLLKGGQPNPRALAAGALVSLMLLAGFAVLLQFAPGNIAPTLRWMRGLGLGFASGPGEQYRFAYVTGPPEPHPVGVSRMWSHLLAMIPVNLHPGRPAAPVQADDSGPLFESITIQAGSSNDNGAIRLSAAGAFSAENVSLRRLMRWAFQVDDFQILGAPSWLDSEKFRISAKAPANTDRSRAGAMLQNALRDRFHLQLSWLPRTTPVYILEAAAGGRRPKATEDFVEGPSRV